jgi:carbonic anhydrase/acetyltransferase-like protein (isoleucine patch superfamily)
VHIYPGVEIGQRVIIHSGAVIGADGFGFVFEEGRYEKFPQVGRVVIGNDVEIGANCTIDRAALGVTSIGDGTKLDNLVHIAHNCRIGRHVVIAAQTGLAGGTVIEDYAVIGGQVGMGDNVTVKSGAVIGSGAGILSSKVVRGGGEVWWGTPARPLKEYLETLAHLSRLPQLRREVEELRKRISELEQQFAIAKPHIEPFVQTDPLNFFALVLCLMVGTAALPHVIMRFFTTPSVREARTSTGWALFFIFLLYFTAPAYAAFAKLEIFENVIGKMVDTIEAAQALPAWVYLYGRIGLVKICGADAASPEAVLAACQQAGITQLAYDPKVFSIHQDVVVISMPEVAGLPYVIAGLVAAGGFAAALSTADGLLLAMANALSHDIYYKMIDPQASTTRRLVVARILLVLVAILGAYLTITAPAHILAYVAWAFSLAAAGLFPALVLGVMWKNANTPGAIAGMVGGFGVTLLYIVGTNTGAMEPWFGVRNISAALFGLPVSFILTYVVSKLTTPPPREIQEFVTELRIPRGPMLMEEARREG